MNEIVGFHNKRTNQVLCVDDAPTSCIPDLEWTAVPTDADELDEYICDGVCGLPLSEVEPLRLVSGSG